MRSPLHQAEWNLQFEQLQYQGVLRCPWYPQQQLRYIGEAPNFHTNPKSDKKKPGSGVERSPVEVVIDWNTIVCTRVHSRLKSSRSHTGTFM